MPGCSCLPQVMWSALSSNSLGVFTLATDNIHMQGTVREVRMSLFHRLRSLVLLLLFLALPLMAQDAGELTQDCTNQNKLFVDNFEKFGALLACFLGAFALPFLFALIPFRFWWALAPRRRWMLTGGLLSLAVLILFAILPALAAARWISPENGLLAYPGVQPNYIVKCRAESVRETPLFGFLGSQHTTSIAQPYYLFLALAASLIIWTLLLALTFKLFRRRYGLRS